MMVLVKCLCAAAAMADLPPIVIDRNDRIIERSGRVIIEPEVLADEQGDGALRIVGSDLTIDFTGAELRGSIDGVEPDTYSGTGLVIIGKNIEIRGGQFSGYKVAIHARDADGLIIDGADVSNNYRQRLRSTMRAEAAEDWLWPHDNDDGEWMTRYGAGISVEDSKDVTIRNVRARHVQNGILLSRVSESRVYDNDCSFLSGWGLALWRSSRNVISRNAFDFCIRGYSHGVYNRGQDSAGILLFEQCSENIIAENSATHGGDGLFAFAGREALGEVSPREDLEWYRRRGNNGNIIVGNDFSYAAAHGLELTFGFGNVIAHNRFVGNAICGIWGGFSQDTLIVDNYFAANGEMPYGSERGGINVEHGAGNTILMNTFEENACGIFFWTRDHSRLLELPWARANHRGSVDNAIMRNSFHGDDVGIQLRRCGRTILAENQFKDVRRELDDDEESRRHQQWRDIGDETPPLPRLELYGDEKPIGARSRLAGREHIIMTEWGPYDWASPMLRHVERTGNRSTYRVLNDDEVGPAQFTGAETLEVYPPPDHRYVLVTERAGHVVPYTLTVQLSDGDRRVAGVLVPTEWSIRVFAWETDPREDVDAWRAEAASGVSFTADALQLRYGHGGPSDLPNVPEAVAEAALPRDRFGTIAETTLTFPPGRWRLRTVSDDGIRVWLNDALVIDDWTWHAPTEHAHEFELIEPETFEIRVEHFELDGYSVLTLDIEQSR